jgi:hypothetical protein
LNPIGIKWINAVTRSRCYRFSKSAFVLHHNFPQLADCSDFSHRSVAAKSMISRPLGRERRRAKRERRARPAIRKLCEAARRFYRDERRESH